MKQIKWGKRQQIYVVIGVLLSISIIISYFIYILVLNQVVLNVDGKSYRWKTLSLDVAGVLRGKNIMLSNGDVVRPALKTAVREGLKIKVIRSFPVDILTMGTITRVNTISRTVGEVLRRARVQYCRDDKVFPGLETVVQPYQKIRIIKVTSIVITQREEVEPITEYRKDQDLEQGIQKILRAGQPGLAERRIKVIYEDGREVRHFTIAEKILKPAASSIILVGIRPVIRTLYTSRGSYRYIEMKFMTATAYYPGPECCGKYAVYGETYTGKKAGFGIVAIDPKVIKLGTKLYIEGYGKAEAADIGRAIKGNRIDLCYETFREAAMYGTKKVKVYILFE